MKAVKIGILGLGTVGGGVVNVLKSNSKEIARRTGREIIISRALVKDLSRQRTCDTQAITLTTNPDEIIDDPEIEVILELMGGTQLAKDLVIHALDKGKHIVTANKALIALHGNEIFAKANENGAMVLFEAAVAGGIPIIKAIREGLSGNQIEWLAGIINGTSNFILTEMGDKHRDFAEALAEAQALGYAEADPAFDVEGIDAGHKLAILASLAFGIPLQFDKVVTEGISEITQADVEYAKQLGYRIKHLGIARKTALGIELRVHLTLIPERCLIANVDGVMNAVLVVANAVGATLYYGAGAGSNPTASAVVADIVDVVRALINHPKNRVPPLAFQTDAMVDIPILSAEQINTAYYLRLKVKDKPGVLAEVTKILATYQISIEVPIQKKPLADEPNIAVVMLTQMTLEKKMNAAMTEIEALSTVIGSISRIRLETLG